MHEAIRRHSMAAAEQVKVMGKGNDLIDRLRGDGMFAGVDLMHVMEPGRYTGRCGVQVDRFIERVVVPIRQRYAGELERPAELKV